jgi:hypothetical protein
MLSPQIFTIDKVVNNKREWDSLERKTEPLAVKERDTVERTDLTHIAQEIRKVNLRIQ